MMRHGRCLLALALPFVLGMLAASAATPLQAAVLYSNLGPGDSFSTTSSWSVRGTATDSGYSAIGVRFVATGSGNVSSIDVAFVQDEASSASDILFQLFADDGNTFPDFAGGVLDELTLNGSAVAKARPALYSASSSSAPFLTIGTPYWLIAATGGKAFFGWNQTDPIVSGGMFTDQTSPAGPDGTVTNATLATLRVNAVPEPSTFFLGSLAVTFGVIAGFRRRRSTAKGRDSE
jgi:hypothetical protein